MSPAITLFWTLVSLTHTGLGRGQPPHSAPTFYMHREDAKEALKHVFVPRPALCRPLSAVSLLLGMARLTRLGWEGEFGYGRVLAWPTRMTSGERGWWGPRGWSVAVNGAHALKPRLVSKPWMATH